MDLPAPGLMSYAEPRVPWRRTAIIVSAIAAVELIALLVVALAFMAKPFADDAAAKPKAPATETAAAGTASPALADANGTQPAAAGAKPVEPPAVAELPRTKTPILVLNGNGIAGAASATASRVKALRYPIAGIGDASRRDFPRSVVMYGPGLQGEAERLARDLDLGAGRAVPLDGMRPADLGKAKLVLVVGS